MPPSPFGPFLSSCTPADLVDNCNSCMTWVRQAHMALDAYLFWGAEYWLLRQQTAILGTSMLFSASWRRHDRPPAARPPSGELARSPCHVRSGGNGAPGPF